MRLEFSSFLRLWHMPLCCSVRQKKFWFSSLAVDFMTPTLLEWCVGGWALDFRDAVNVLLRVAVNHPFRHRVREFLDQNFVWISYLSVATTCSAHFVISCWNVGFRCGLPEFFRLMGCYEA
jgi:hypothetical protein